MTEPIVSRPQFPEGYVENPKSLFGYAPNPSQWDEGGLFEVTPQKAFAWTNFTEDPTRFILLQDE
jgi:hypothetical protein